jgi:uncharacterized membrane protein
MNLPPLSIPDFPLPFIVPEMIHPLLVHFAVALPVLIILFEIVNLVLKRRAIGVTSFVLLLLMIAVYVGAYLTGVTDAQLAKKMLTPEAKEMLPAHKQLGVYLVYGSLVVLFFKLVSSMVKKFIARLVFLIVLILFTVTVFNEGHQGNQLVYVHGANVQAVGTAKHAQPEAAVNPSDEKTKAVSSTVEKAMTTTQEMIKEKTEKAVEATQKQVEEVTEAVKEKAVEATETVKEKAGDVVEKAKEAVKEAIQPEHEAPVKTITPVETVPAG